MMRTMRKTVTSLLAVCMLLCTAVALGLGGVPSARAEGAEARKVLRFSIDTAHEDFQSETFNKLNDQTYLAIMTTPFSVTGKDVGVAFKEGSNFLANWWEGIGDTFSVEYEYALSVPLSGFGSIAVSVDKAPWVWSHGPVDQDGNDAIAPFESKDLINNGWRKRTINYDANAAADPKAVLNDLYFAISILKGDIPESGTMDLFVRSIYLNYKGVRRALYDSSASETFWKNVCKSSFTSTYTTEFRFAGGASQRIAEGAGLTLDTMQLNDALHYGGAWSEIDMPSFSTISESAALPAALTVGETYNLNSFVTATEGKTATISQVKLGEEAVAVEDATKFMPMTEGTYSLTYTVQADYPSTKTISIQCERAVKPVFDARDVNAAVPATGKAHLPVELGKVKALLGGVKSLDTTVEVHKGAQDGEAVTVTDNGAKGWSFTPTAKTKTDVTYYVRYKAENSDEGETYTAYSDWKTVVVSDVDKPVFDFSNMFDSATVGSRYKLEQITDGLKVTDISDGNITDYTVEIIDPTGKKMTPTDEGYFVTNSGAHKVIVTATDSDENTTTGTGEFWAAATNGCVIQATFNVDADKRAKDIRKYDIIHLFNLSPKALMLVAGSKIRYEVMAYTVIDGQMTFIPGVGAISGQLSPSWEFMHEAISEKAKDNNGLGMKATADLSSKLSEDGKALWLQREYTVTKDDGIDGEQFYHLAVAIDTQAAVGEQIYVYYRNLEVVKPDGITTVSLGTAADEFEDAWKGDDKAVNVSSHNISATIDRYPVYLDGEIPATVGLGKTVHLSKYVMKDAYHDTFVTDISYRVVGPDDQEVALTETADDFTFVANKRGNYEVTLIGTNDIGSTTVHLTIKADDTEEPTIIKGTFSEIKKGQLFTASFTCADNVTAAADLEVEVSVFLVSKSIQSSLTYEDGVATVTFTPQETGTYRIIVTVTDEAGREATQEFTVELKEGGTNPDDNKDDNKNEGKGGCGSAAAAMLSVLAACAVTFLMKK